MKALTQIDDLLNEALSLRDHLIVLHSHNSVMKLKINRIILKIKKLKKNEH